MNEFLSQFHFLRPEWFWALIPAVLLYGMLKYRQSVNSSWERAIDPALLPHLLDEPEKEVSKSPMTLLLIAWALAIVALAGPVWQKTEQPVHEREDALVVVLDLTRSMYATDVAPNRLIRARHKLQDLLAGRDEGVTGLVVFAGDAHVVSPLTDDTATISSMIHALRPEIMPAHGSQLGPALVRTVELFSDAGVASGRILIITDEVRDAAEAQRVAREHRFAYPVSVMSVGTQEGTPIELDPGNPNSGFLKDRNGNLVMPRVDTDALADFAAIAGGRFAAMTLTDEDLDYLLAPDPLLVNEEFRLLDRDFDIWHEHGPWLLLLLLPLASFAFRRGWLWSLVLLVMLPTDQSYAFEWEDLWQTRDQRGIEALEQGQPNEAAAFFEDPAWKGSALYRGENYDQAGAQFAGIESTEGRYNLGNALARQMWLEEAIDAYAESLTLDPGNADAAFNKQLVEDLLDQQQQQQQQQQGEQDQEDENQQEQDGQDQQQADNEEQERQKEEEEQGEKQEQAEQQLEEQELAEEDSELDSEEEQALKQWLRRVPDNPGGLLTRKFAQQYQERMEQGKIHNMQGSDDW